MSTTNRQQFLIDYLKARQGIPIRKAINNLRRHRYTADEIRKAQAEIRGDLINIEGVDTPPTAVRKIWADATDKFERSAYPAKVRKTVASLLNQFDDVEKVHRTMKGLGQSEYMDDEEMRRTNSIGIERWRAVKQHAMLQPYQFKLPNGRFVWMHMAAQKKLQDAINLSET